MNAEIREEIRKGSTINGVSIADVVAQAVYANEDLALLFSLALKPNADRGRDAALGEVLRNIAGKAMGVVISEMEG